MSHKIQIDAAPLLVGSRYPHPYGSSQRHWHSGEDEFIYVLEGELVLVCDDGEELLRSGDCAGFAAGERVGHHLQNRSAREALALEVGTRGALPATELVDYPDIDMQLHEGRFVHRDGTPYPPPRPANQEAAPPSPSPGTAPSARR